MTESHQQRENLMKVFKLGPEDLDANRAGRLSPREAQHLRTSGTNNLLLSFVLGLILAALLMFVVHRPLKPAQPIVAGVIFLAGLAAGIYDFRRCRAAADAGTVETLAGPIQIRSRGKQGMHIQVQNRSFRLPIHFWHLQNGASYRVYVSPRANRIVAIEPET